MYSAYINASTIRVDDVYLNVGTRFLHAHISETVLYTSHVLAKQALVQYHELVNENETL